MLIADLFPHPPVSPLGGRPRIPPRECLEGILWVLRTGCPWQDLPERYPSPATCWRRLDEWTRSGVFAKAWHRLLGKLDSLKQIRWEECMADATFSPAKKGGNSVGLTKKGKGTKIGLMVDGDGLPLSTVIAGANVAEVHMVETLVETSLDERFPERLIYDKAADADWLRDHLAEHAVELICPHRKNRKSSPRQDGRPLRRYRRRWIVERTISWLQSRRRVVTRYEYHDDLFNGLVQLACLVITLKWF
ncbi:IS5 family transposase [Thalassoglobus sp. JC818]|uniref:IS5 family transposase n=1 Tax=Thalassoglobus sp. JC818 TaxID=3232136 RepID=UPI003458ACA9